MVLMYMKLGDRSNVIKVLPTIYLYAAGTGGKVPLEDRLKQQTSHYWQRSDRCRSNLLVFHNLPATSDTMMPFGGYLNY
jgi:hypothetical protein